MTARIVFRSHSESFSSNPRDKSKRSSIKRTETKKIRPMTKKSRQLEPIPALSARPSREGLNRSYLALSFAAANGKPVGLGPNATGSLALTNSSSGPTDRPTDELHVIKQSLFYYSVRFQYWLHSADKSVVVKTKRDKKIIRIIKQ